MKTCLVAGMGSDIFKAVRPMMEREGWQFYDAVEISFSLPFQMMPKWDLLLMPMGRVAPVGHWWDMSPRQFYACLESNLIAPWELLRLFWHWRGHKPQVVWFSGSNPQGIMDGYAPYNVGKMAVNKMIEQLDHETPDTTFVAFGPGYYGHSKIHNATRDAGWPNERMARGDMGNTIEQIWSALRWTLQQDKATVGGRNIATSDYLKHGDALGDWLRADSNRLKLRRIEA